MAQENKIALITGATSGIGAAFAKKFASQHYDLIITGRREKKIKTFAKSLIDQYAIKVEVMISELANNNDLAALIEKVKSLDKLDILIHNAGFTRRNYFFEEDLAFYEDMVKVHVLATMKLTRAALDKMLIPKKGIIVNVSSMRSFFPLTKNKNSIYGATKLFINFFTESVALELKETKIHMQVLCPGVTRTDIFERMGENIDEVVKKYGILSKVMTPESVVEESLKCLSKGKIVCIPGIRNKLKVILSTFRRLI